MPVSRVVPPFGVISGAQVASALEGQERRVIELVRAAYACHGAGDTVNPKSMFLRFPDRPADRIIALPASVGGDFAVDGIKWIASVPGNIEHGIPRASAVLVLNDRVTGYPFACLESSIISASRTAASAALAATLIRPPGSVRRVGFIGTGLIARYVHQYLTAAGYAFDEIGLFDLSVDHAEGFRSYLNGAKSYLGGERPSHDNDRPFLDSDHVVVLDSAESLIRASDLVVFATVAGAPHVTDPALFDHHPLVLHLSLRDLAPEVILSAINIVDDVDHCLTANTSPHLAEALTGNRDFIHGSIDDVASGRFTPPPGRTVVVSPFGLGVLDLALAKFVNDRVSETGESTVIADFFHDLSRHG